MGQKIGNSIVIFLLLIGLSQHFAVAAPTKQEALAALRKAAEFYVTKVGNEAGYHGRYTVNLGSGESGKKGEWQISGSGPQTTQGATPTVGMALLEAWEATGDRYFLKAAQSAAHGLLKGQMCSGGWDERETELNPAERQNYRFLADGGCSSTEEWVRDYYLPNETSDKQVGKRRNMTNLDNNITQSVLRMLMRVYSYYNINDDCMLNVMDAMLEAARIYNEPKYRASAEKVGVFLLLAQMPDPQPAWAQQYNREMHPDWARSMEPPAISGRESVSVLYALLALYRETGKAKYLEPIPRALDYLNRCVYVKDGKRVLARFYELKTNRRLYISPGAPGVRAITYSDENLHHGYTFATPAEPLEKIAAQYRELLAAKPEDIRRPEKLKSLNPITETKPPEMSKTELAEKVSEVIAALDERGAWLEADNTGKKKVQPGERVIASGTFAKNVKLLSNYLLNR